MKQYDWIAGVACDKVSTNRNTIVQCYHRMNEWSKNPKQKETTAYLECLYMRVRYSYLCIGLFQYIVSLRIESNGMNGNSKLIHLLARSLALCSALFCYAVLCHVVPGLFHTIPNLVSWDACRYIIHWNFHLYIRRPRIHSIVCVGVGVCVRLLSYTHMHCMRSFIQLGKLNVTAHYLVPPIVVCFFVMFHFPV